MYERERERPTGDGPIYESSSFPLLLAIFSNKAQAMRERERK